MHLESLMLICVSSCFCVILVWDNIFWKELHLYGLLAIQILWCIFNILSEKNDSPQYLQKYILPSKTSKSAIVIWTRRIFFLVINFYVSSMTLRIWLLWLTFIPVYIDINSLTLNWDIVIHFLWKNLWKIRRTQGSNIINFKFVMYIAHPCQHAYIFYVCFLWQET